MSRRGSTVYDASTPATRGTRRASGYRVERRDYWQHLLRAARQSGARNLTVNPSSFSKLVTLHGSDITGAILRSRASARRSGGFALTDCRAQSRWMRLSVDFTADLVAHMRQVLRKRRLKSRATDTPDEVGYNYALMKRREIPARPRGVYVAKDFVCLAEHLDGVAEIRRKAAAGESLAPHQHRVRRADAEDALLNDWDVHHLHLGLTLEADGSVKRTKALLFARVTDDAFYMIGVYHHPSRHGGNHRGDWSRQNVFQTIEDNWPESLIRVGSQPETYISDNELADLRESGISSLPAAAGSVYAPPGLGIACDGSSVRARMMSDAYFRWARALEHELIDNLDAIVAAARSKGVELTEPLEFHLVLDDNDVAFVVEKNSSIRVPLTDRRA